MRFVAVMLALLVLTGCATVDMGGDEDVSGLSTFTMTDLHAALDQATAQGDQAGVNCWTTLLAIVQSGPVKMPEIKGVASAIQARRGVTNSGGLNTLKKQINVGCAALFVSETVTLARLLGKSGLLP